MGRVVSLIYASFLECLRATVFIFIGSSVTAQAILRRNLSDNTVVCVGWGAAYLLSSLVLIGVYGTYSVSLNFVYGTALPVY
ncbi:unnamed protein product [Bursaphelenchus okinawaensis]|uniref:7TM_GPCR_Srx domain-containing protein n=1 Tax=Bursaphelenchus okinawaensis TaxID=465554 RepID=A0A811L737_9BILA|nr:unnamed protein product [Bursaphelenchus okinawaensis]CAG9119645.1 unnamed protein product [Bursaphelenchus okinawaensis]